MTLLRKEAILICTYNRPEPLRKTLEAISGCRMLPEHLVIVDGSDKEQRLSEETIRGHLNRSDVTLHYRTSPAEASLQRDATVSIIKDQAELLHFLDDDVSPHQGYFEAISRHMREHRDCVAAGGIILPLGKLPSEIRFLEKLFLLNSVKPGRWLRSGFTSEGQARRDLTRKAYTEVEWLSLCSLTVRSEVASRYPFDPNLQKATRDDDLDFCIRIGREGEMHTVSSALITHRKDSGDRDEVRRFVNLIRNRYYLLQKHRPGYLSALLFRWAMIGKMLALIRNGPEGRAKVIGMWRRNNAPNSH